jgi:hypothetical protein
MFVAEYLVPGAAGGTAIRKVQLLKATLRPRACVRSFVLFSFFFFSS